MTINSKTLVDYFHSLKPWKSKYDFTKKDWKLFIAVAKLIQSVDSATLEEALQSFMKQAINLDENYQGYENESKLFLLLRIVFDIPETSTSTEKFSYKGWTNWPLPTDRTNTNPAWPISWKNGKPKLLDSYEGSMGQPYAAIFEYRFFKEHYKFRKLT